MRFRLTVRPIVISDSRSRTKWRRLHQLATVPFNRSVYGVDPQIPESRARHSRREWVRNGFKGRAEAIYVAESENRLVGFALLRSKAGTEKVGEIELIAVDPAFHGRGIGKELVAEAIRHYQGKTSKIQVGTQAKNLRAIGLYTRMGFSVIRSELSFHRHSEARA